MKKVFLTIVVIFIIACNNSTDDNSIETVSSDTLAFGENPGDTLYFWNIDNEHNTRTKVLTIPVEHPNVQAIINGLNMVYPDVILLFSKITGDTLHVSIPQSEILTQQMGSAGASQYLATACVNLFEAKNINYIHFDFKEGDHARPGVYSRSQFAGIKEIK